MSQENLRDVFFQNVLHGKLDVAFNRENGGQEIAGNVRPRSGRDPGSQLGVGPLI